MHRRLMLLAASIIFVPAASQSQSLLVGRVVSDSGQPIAGATVTLNSVRYSVKTDSLGRFQLNGTPGSTLALTVQATGFRQSEATVVLARGRATQRDFSLTSDIAERPVASVSDQLLRVRAITVEHEPIAYANLQVNGGRRYVSDDSGRFDLPIMVRGKSTVLVRRIGFEPAELVLTEMPDTPVQIQMRPVARTLETQSVTVRSPFARLDLRGFYGRMTEVERGAGVGYFVTPEDLALRNPQNVTDAVEQFPSIRLRPINDARYCRDGTLEPGKLCGIPSTRRMRIEDNSGCPLTVYLDGTRIQPSITNLAPVDEEVNTLVQPNSVAGIELYPRAQGAPPQFPPYAFSNCSSGVVLIWTK